MVFSWVHNGGELGIRTPDTFRYAGFQDRCNRPLYQLSTARVLCKIPNVKSRTDFVGALFIFAQMPLRMLFQTM